MDYEAFYKDVCDWISEANQMALMHGLHSENFWAWVAQSSGEICAKYRDNRLVIKQMMMLTEWLEEVYEKRSQRGVSR